MMPTGTTSTWPAPYLQPDRTRDCGYYTAAYTAHCLGHPDVTAQQIRQWRAATRRLETVYLRDVLGVEFRSHLDSRDGSGSHKMFWLGPGAEDWLRSWLDDGWIAALQVHRLPTCGHAVTLLAAGPDGGLLHDPIYGHITEPWGWLLGPGLKNGRDDWPGKAPDGREFFGCTYVEGWYRK